MYTPFLIMTNYCAQMQHNILTLTFGWLLIYLRYLSLLRNKNQYQLQSSPGLSFYLSVLLACLLHNLYFYLNKYSQ